LVNDYKADIEVRNSDGWTALHRTASGGHEGVVRLLLECKADVKAKDLDSWMALHLAAEKGHEAVVRLLPEDYKADVQVKTTNDGMTALRLAAENNHKVVIRLLLDYKADIERRLKMA
jgi:ankyrin repeat protein